jgi:tetratricopeptide (TPR) repeat protein
LVEVGVDAARFQGRVCRKLAEWNDALAWYGVAHALAEEIHDVGTLAYILDGLANTHRDRGNLPRARAVLEEILALGTREGADEILAVGYHALMTVEKQAGNLEAAVLCGWRAIRTWGPSERGLHALFDLAGVFREGGDLSAAEDAYAVVARRVGTYDHRVMSLDALAHIAALRKEEDRYKALQARVDAEPWESGSAVIASQILYFRGLSLLALGRETEGRAWLRRALTFAEEHAFGKLVFDIEAALTKAGDPNAAPGLDHALCPGPPQEPGGEARGVRRELREMREALVEAGSLP